MSVTNCFDFVNRVLIVDDSEEDVSLLKEELEERKIHCTFINPSISSIDWKPINSSVQLVFMDFKLTQSDNITSDISTIKSILEIIPKNSAYGMILWTSHTKDVHFLQESFDKDISQNDFDYLPPCFIICLDKSILNKENCNIFLSLENEINNDKAATFFTKWMSDVYMAANNTMLTLYRLMPNYLDQSNNFLGLLFLIASRQFGQHINEISNQELTQAAFYSIDDLICSYLRKNHSLICHDIVTAKNSNLNRKNINYTRQIASINTALFIDCCQYDNEDKVASKTIIFPGTVYKYKHSENDIKFGGKILIPADSTQIIVELTPPCDFAQGKKILSRFVCGYIVYFSFNDYMAIFENKRKTDICKLLTMSMGDFGYRTGPFLKSMVGKTLDKKSYKEDQTNKEKENDTHQFCVLLFNFNQLLTIKDSEINTTSYKVLFRLNHDLFADILQKFSSHASRLGTSVIGF